MFKRDVDLVKAQAKELLRRIDEMERCAGFTKFRPPDNEVFNYGQFTASVKRGSMDLTRSLVALRR